MSKHTKPSEKQTPLGVQDAGPCSQNHFKVYAMILEWEQTYWHVYFSCPFSLQPFTSSILGFPAPSRRSSLSVLPLVRWVGQSWAVGFKYSQGRNAWVLPLPATVLATGCPTEAGMASSAQCELPVSVSAGSHLWMICSEHVYWLYFFGEWGWR